MKKLLAIATAISTFALFAPTAFAAIAFTQIDHLTSTSQSITVASMTNGALYVYVNSNGGSTVPTAVTLGGVNLTKIGSDVASADLTGSMWFLLNPSAGSGTLAMTGGGTGGWAMQYSGVNQSLTYVGGTPTDNGYFGHSTTNSVSVSATTIQNNSWVMGYAEPDSFGNNSSSLTIRNGSPTYGWLGDTNGPKTPAGAVTVTFGSPGTSVFTHSIVTISPAIVAPSTPPLPPSIISDF